MNAAIPSGPRVELGDIFQQSTHQHVFDVRLVYPTETYIVRNCSLIGPTVSGTYRVYSPTRTVRGEMIEHLDLPFSVRLTIRDLVRAVLVERVNSDG